MSTIELYTAPWEIAIEIVGFGPIELGRDPKRPLMIIENTMPHPSFQKTSPFLACYGKSSEKKPNIDFPRRNFISPYDQEYNRLWNLFYSFCAKSYDAITEIILHLGTNDIDSERFLTWEYLSEEELLNLGVSYGDFIRIRKSEQIRKRKLLIEKNIPLREPRQITTITSFNIKEVYRPLGSKPKNYPTLDQQEGNPDAW